MDHKKMFIELMKELDISIVKFDGEEATVRLEGGGEYPVEFKKYIEFERKRYLDGDDMIAAQSIINLIVFSMRGLGLIRLDEETGMVELVEGH